MRSLIRIILMMALIPLFSIGSPAEGKTVPHPLLSRFAMNELEGVVAWRDLQVGRRFLHLLLEHAPKLSRFEEAAKRLKEVNLSGFQPFLGQTQALDPVRGLYLMWTESKEVRLLIHHRAGKAKEALEEAKSLIIEVGRLNWSFSLQDESQTHDLSPLKPTAKSQKRFQCQRQQELLVCDSIQFIPAKAPYWLSSDLDRGAFWGMIQKPSWLPRLFFLPWTDFEFHFDLNGDELNLSLNIGAGFNHLLSLLQVGDQLSPLLQWVHADTPFVLKLSLDPEVIKQASLFEDKLPWLQQAKELIMQGWNGEVLLTFDGGFDHPVLLLNLHQDAWRGEQLSAYLSKRLGFQQLQILDGISDAGPSIPLSWWTIHNDGKSPWLVPTLIHDETLMIALFPADLKRRTHGLFTSKLSPSLIKLERNGMSGGVIDPSLFELNDLLGGRIHQSTLSAALIRLFNEGGSGLIDVPAPLKGEEGSLAESLVRFSRFNNELLVQLLGPLTQDESCFIALADLTALFILLTDEIHFTLHSHNHSTKGGFALSMDWVWSIL